VCGGIVRRCRTSWALEGKGGGGSIYSFTLKTFKLQVEGVCVSGGMLVA
jgi:hypothetical protein